MTSAQTSITAESSPAPASNGQTQGSRQLWFQGRTGGQGLQVHLLDWSGSGVGNVRCMLFSGNFGTSTRRWKHCSTNKLRVRLTKMRTKLNLRMKISVYTCTIQLMVYCNVYNVLRAQMQKGTKIHCSFRKLCPLFKRHRNKSTMSRSLSVLYFWSGSQQVSSTMCHLLTSGIRK